MLTELIVRIADLLEAEGRAARRAIERLGMGLSLTVVAAALVLVGCLLVFTGVFLGLGRQIGEAGAAAITGVLTLGVAAGLFWWSSKLMK